MRFHVPKRLWISLIVAGGTLPPVVSRGDCGAAFQRGDTDCSTRLDLADAVIVLRFLFTRGERPCLDAADASDDGKIDILDVLQVLLHLFGGGPPPAAPFSRRGIDPTPDGLGCATGLDPTCPVPLDCESIGVVEEPRLVEPSGIGPSRSFSDVLWVVNDSNNAPLLHALSGDGSPIRAIQLCLDATDCPPRGPSSSIHIDWEALAVGKGPDGSEVVYIADIGDNHLPRTLFWIHRVPVGDPRGDFGADPLVRAANDFDTLFFQYPGVATRNAEVLLRDPATGRLFIVNQAGEVFRYPGEERAGETVVLEKIGSVEPFGTGRAPWIQDGGITPDGRWMALKGGAEVRFFAWTSNAPAAGLGKARCRLDLVEYVGRALEEFHAGNIAFESATSFVTLEEEKSSRIFRMTFSE